MSDAYRPRVVAAAADVFAPEWPWSRRPGQAITDRLNEIAVTVGITDLRWDELLDAWLAALDIAATTRSEAA